MDRRLFCPPSGREAGIWNAEEAAASVAIAAIADTRLRRDDGVDDVEEEGGSMIVVGT